ncbi:phospholipid-transporting ATPase VA isoform X2 [Centruroides vittatus]
MTDQEQNIQFNQPCVQCSRTSFLSKIFRKCKSSSPSDKEIRIVVPNHTTNKNISDRQHPNHAYLANKIRTTRYTILSFIPKNIFEQFHRFANLYFLGIVVLNWLIEAFGREISMVPLGFVLGVTAVKDAFEDWRRYKSDKRVNSSTCRIFNKNAGRYIKTLWKNVHVGDIVHLSCNEIIPADILLLRSSDPQGLCYIETANIDGESNLKQRQVIRDLTSQNANFHPTDFNRIIECDSPNNKIYKFHGCVVSPDGCRIAVTKENLVLRDCVLKNTDFIEGIVLYTGHETKAMLNNGGPRYKRSKLEKLMNKHILGCIGILVVLCLIGAIGYGLWINSYINIKQVPFIPNNYTSSSPVAQGAYSIFTFIIILQVIIPLSLYVTIEIIKLGQIYFIHEDVELYDEISNKRVECRALNIPEELGQVQYVFSDKTGTLTENCMIFRRCTIGGIDYNHHPTNVKVQTDGNIEKKQNNLKDDTFIVNPRLQDELCQLDMEINFEQDMKVYLLPERQRIQDFFLLMAICNTVVVSKYPHKDQMNSSGLFLNIPPINNESHVLGSGDIPQDKYTLLINSVDTPSNSAASTPNWRPKHLAIPSFGSRSYTPTPTPSPADFRPIYEAESPDEIALVEAAFHYNCRLLRRTPDAALIFLPGEGLIEFKVLHILPFDSVRKRMSVILQHPFTGEKLLYCKGSDSTVLTQISHNQTSEMQEIIMKTQQHLNNYSRKGLRILCMAKKVISPEEYEEWLYEHRKAELSIEDQEEKLHISACQIETNLELLGATGVEDRLQSGVPETINALRSAGIVLWVLTGDKQETAINIAYSCKLFSSNMEIITLNARSVETTEDTIKFYLDQMNKDLTAWNTSPKIKSSVFNSFSKFFNKKSKSTNCILNTHQSYRQKGMVIDGRTLSYILDKRLSPLFLELASRCHAVLCCRATPLQKASIIKLVKESLHVLTLAIGDGANDVSMIQTADVGIGISGQEGMQAVMASDFALARFRHLERLLLVHGHWCYDRLARTILYFFYKNANLIFVLFWFQFFCGFTGSVMIDQMYLMFVNVLFTSISPVVVGIYDQDCRDYVLLQNPGIYSRGRNSELYTKYSFIVNMVDAIYQSIIIFFVPYVMYYDSNLGIWEFGTITFTACVVVQLVHLSIETKSWTWIHFITIIISLGLYFAFAVVYNSVCISCPGLQNPYWVIQHLMKTANFWFCILFVTVTSCLPRYVIQSIKNQFWPSDVVRAKLEQKENKKYSEQSTLSVSWSRGSSGSSIVIRNGNPPENANECQEGNIPTVSAICDSSHSINSPNQIIA